MDHTGPVIGRALPYAFAAGAGAGLVTGEALATLTAIVAVYPYAHLLIKHGPKFRRRGTMPRHRK